MAPLLWNILSSYVPINPCTNIPGSRNSIARRLTSAKGNVSSFAAVVTTKNSASRCRSASVLSADNPFYRQVVLLVELLPLVAREPCFALKGGTAINLFVRDLPRLSVDIDLTYLPIESREESLSHIGEALHRLGSIIEAALR